MTIDLNGVKVLIVVKQKERRNEMYDYSKLRGRIVEKYGSMSAFADVLGTSKVTVSLKMNNELGFTRENIIKWADLLDIPEEEYALYFFCKTT